MIDEFYCGKCGKFKKNELKQQSPAGKRPVCKSCSEKIAKIISERSESSREKRRSLRHKQGIEHLMPRDDQPN
jgi:NAD-dependent SIR2 family protein deacetylase